VEEEVRLDLPGSVVNVTFQKISPNSLKKDKVWPIIRHPGSSKCTGTSEESNVGSNSGCYSVFGEKGVTEGGVERVKNRECIC